MSQHIIEADVAPSEAPPRVGMHYIDKVAKIAYISVGTTDSNDWKTSTPGTADYQSDGSVAMTGTHNANSNVVDNLLLKAYGETINTPIISGTLVTFNLADGNIIDLNLDQNVSVITISGILGAGMNISFTVYAKQDATGNRSITWPTQVDWGLQGVPSLSVAANSTDIFCFTTRDGGTTWAAFHGGYGYTTL